MISVDNFYFVLNKNLFEPLGISAWGCYPFGSTTLVPLNKSRHSLTWETRPKLEIILWDQEPFDFRLYKNSINSDDCRIGGLRPNVIAVSDICRESQIVPYNWYYFFHGFAALDWYRDAQYLPLLNNTFSNVFICLNRLVTKERSYRLALVADLINKDLIKYGAVSLTSKETWPNEINDSNTKLTSQQIELITSVFSRHTEDLYLDSKDTPGWASAGMSSDEVELFQDSFLHVVTETIFYSKKLHLTEKIFRPIVMCRPFVLAGAVGNLAYLKRYGFQTFDRWWDESYDLETDPAKRLEKITAVIDQLCKLSITELQDMYQEMLPVIRHNQEHFYNGFKKHIVNELLDNYVQLLTTLNDKFNLEGLGQSTRNDRENRDLHYSSPSGNLGNHCFDIDSLNIPLLKQTWSK